MPPRIFLTKSFFSWGAKIFFERLKSLPGQLDRRLGSEIGNLRHISEKVSARIGVGVGIGGRLGLGLATLSRSVHPILILSLSLSLMLKLPSWTCILIWLYSHTSLFPFSQSSQALLHTRTCTHLHPLTHAHMLRKNTSDVFKCTHSLSLFLSHLTVVCQTLSRTALKRCLTQHIGAQFVLGLFLRSFSCTSRTHTVPFVSQSGPMVEVSDTLDVDLYSCSDWAKPRVSLYNEEGLKWVMWGLLLRYLHQGPLQTCRTLSMCNSPPWSFGW